MRMVVFIMFVVRPEDAGVDLAVDDNERDKERDEEYWSENEF